MDFKTKVIEAFNDKLIITSDSVFIYTPMGVIFNFINDETLEYSIDGNIHTFYDKDGKTTVEQIKEHFRLRFAKKEKRVQKERKELLDKVIKEKQRDLLGFDVEIDKTKELIIESRIRNFTIDGYLRSNEFISIVDFFGIKIYHKMLKIIESIEKISTDYSGCPILLCFMDKETNKYHKPSKALCEKISEVYNICHNYNEKILKFKEIHNKL